MKKFHGHHMLSLSLSVSQTRIYIYIFLVVLVDEGREGQNTAKVGLYRPASETPFDGIGSSKEHKCENSLNFRNILDYGPLQG